MLGVCPNSYQISESSQEFALAAFDEFGDWGKEMVVCFGGADAGGAGEESRSVRT